MSSSSVLTLHVNFPPHFPVEYREYSVCTSDSVSVLTSQILSMDGIDETFQIQLVAPCPILGDAVLNPSHSFSHYEKHLEDSQGVVVVQHEHGIDASLLSLVTAPSYVPYHSNVIGMVLHVSFFFTFAFATLWQKNLMGHTSWFPASLSFYTTWTVLSQMFFWLFSLTMDVGLIPSNGAINAQYLSAIACHVTYCFAIISTGCYWALHLYNPSLLMSSSIPPLLNAIQHVIPIFAVLLHFTMGGGVVHRIQSKTSVAALALYSVAANACYFAFVYYRHVNGARWPYPFMKSLFSTETDVLRSFSTFALAGLAGVALISFGVSLVEWVGVQTIKRQGQWSIAHKDDSTHDGEKAKTD